jgi:hypothetical protein
MFRRCLDADPHLIRVRILAGSGSAFELLLNLDRHYIPIRILARSGSALEQHSNTCWIRIRFEILGWIWIRPKRILTQTRLKKLVRGPLSVFKMAKRQLPSSRCLKNHKSSLREGLCRTDSSVISWMGELSKPGNAPDRTHR